MHGHAICSAALAQYGGRAQNALCTPAKLPYTGLDLTIALLIAVALIVGGLHLYAMTKTTDDAR
jgi:hypothetical protein